MEHNGLLKSGNDGTTLAVAGLLQRHTADVIDTTSVENGHHDRTILPLLTVGAVVDRFEHLICLRGNKVGFLLEASQDCLISLLFEVIAFHIDQVISRERNLHSKDLYELLFHLIYGSVVLNNSTCTIIEHISYIHTKALTHEGVATLLIDYGTLFVHHVVVLEQALTNAEVVLLNFLLRALDGAVDHGMFNHFTIFEAETVHDLGDTLGSEQTHELVLQRYKED